MTVTEDQTAWEPLQVLEYTLKVSGNAILSGDFDAFASIFYLPHKVTTFESNRMLKNKDDLFDVFSSVKDHCRMNAITSLVRECISAEFDTKKQIKAAYTSRYLVGVQQIGETTIAYGELSLFEGRWLTTSSQYAVADQRLSRSTIVPTGAATNENQRPADYVRPTSN